MNLLPPIPTQENAHRLLITPRRRLFDKRRMAPRPSFVAWVEDGRIQIRYPAHVRIMVREGFRWRVLFDGSNWAKYSALSMNSQGTLSFDLNRRIAIEDPTRIWDLQIARTLALRTHRTFLSRAYPSKPLSYSLAIHLSLFGLLICAVHFSQHTYTQHKAVTSSFHTKPASSGNSGLAATLQKTPFRGMSYTRFLNRLLAQSPATVQTVSHLLSRLSHLDFHSSHQSTKTTKDADKFFTFHDTNSASTSTTGLADAIGSEHFAVSSKPSEASRKPSRISQEDAARLRETYRELQGSFKRLYSSLLVEDPSFTATVLVETRVEPDGHLVLSAFQPTAAGHAASLEKLRRGMSDLLRAVSVGKQYAGLTLRGENVFLH